MRCRVVGYIADLSGAFHTLYDSRRFVIECRRATQMIEKCHNCRRRIFGQGVRDKFGIFCSMVCRNNVAHPGFCKTCIAATAPISAGDNFRINGIGNAFFNSKDPCGTCGSVVETLWFCLFFIPIVPSGKFRVKYVAPNRYLSRKLPQKPSGQVQSGVRNLTQSPRLPSNWCSRCGASIQADANFCHSCGAPTQGNHLRQ
jgi:hypothetical protein